MLPGSGPFPGARAMRPQQTTQKRKVNSTPSILSYSAFKPVANALQTINRMLMSVPGCRSATQQFYSSRDALLKYSARHLSQLPVSPAQFLSKAVPSIILFLMWYGLNYLLYPLYGRETAIGTAVTYYAQALSVIIMIAFLRASLSDPGRVPEAWLQWDGSASTRPAVPVYAEVNPSWQQARQEQAERMTKNMNRVTVHRPQAQEIAENDAIILSGDMNKFRERLAAGGMMMTSSAAVSAKMFQQTKWQRVDSGGCQDHTCHRGASDKPCSGGAGASSPHAHVINIEEAKVQQPTSAVKAKAKSVSHEELKRQLQEQMESNGMVLRGLDMNNIQWPGQYSQPAQPAEPAVVKAALQPEPADVELNPKLREALLNPFPAKYCERCSAFKPPRTHHCSTCARCVTRMDHHCVWLNNCVGADNWRFFMQFLAFSVVATSTYILFAVNYMVLHDMPGLDAVGFVFYASLLLDMQGLKTVTELLLYQIKLVRTNTTQLESLFSGDGLSKFDQGDVYVHVKALMGPSYLRWLLPCV